jgi:hypothetical protein
LHNRYKSAERKISPKNLEYMLNYSLYVAAVKIWAHFDLKSSPLKPLNQIKPNLAGMVPGWVPFKTVSDSPALHSRWLLLQKIEISLVVNFRFITNQNELKF